MKFHLFIIAALIIFSNCKTPSKAYNKGDYTEAIELGVKKLQKDPNDVDTKNLIQNSYSYEVSKHQDEIRSISNSTTDDRFEKLYQEYAHLQHLYEVIHQYPVVNDMIRPNDYSAELADFGQKAADVHVGRGNQFMDQGNKMAARTAFKEYSTALQFRPNDFEIQKMRDQAYNVAVVNIVVSPIRDLGGYRYGQSFKIDNFQRDIIRTLTRNLNSFFVRFYTEYEAGTNNIEPDQIMELNFSRITIGQPFDEKNFREVSKDVVAKEIVYKPDSVVKQYQTVKAKITTTKRTLLSQGDLFITVRDPRGRIIWNDRFTGEYKWQSQFLDYTGDERALSDNDKTSIKNSSYNPPNEDYILNQLLAQIQNDLSYHLRNYYSNYH